METYKQITRHRTITYDIVEHINVNHDEYNLIQEKRGDDTSYEAFDSAIWEIVGDEWEVDHTEPGDERIVDMYTEEVEDK